MQSPVHAVYIPVPSACLFREAFLKLDESAVPGKTHCGHCAKSLAGRRACGCDKCGLVMYCGHKCRATDHREGHGGSLCEALAAISALEDLWVDCDVLLLSSTWSRLVVSGDDRIKSWTELWDENVLLDSRSLASVWSVTERLSAPLSFAAAMGHEAIVKEFSKATSLSVDFVGVEWEFGSRALRSIWRDVFRRFGWGNKVEARLVGPLLLLQDEEDNEGEGERFVWERALYLAREPKPNIVFALNPGFSVPDYDWSAAIESMQQSWLISTCHSMEEAIVERDSELLSSKFMCVAQVENPWPSLRYHQSGTIR